MAAEPRLLLRELCGLIASKGVFLWDPVGGSEIGRSGTPDRIIYDRGDKRSDGGKSVADEAEEKEDPKLHLLTGHDPGRLDSSSLPQPQPASAERRERARDLRATDRFIDTRRDGGHRHACGRCHECSAPSAACCVRGS